MIRNLPELDISGNKLVAVPAIHYRAVFAMQVLSAFNNRKTRPDAIAVELGPAAVAMIKNWFRELGIIGKNKPFPTMLGLAHQNKRIHPRYKSRAMDLQQKYGKPLHKIPPSVLKDKINYSPVSLICLSSVDSIIEAIRCAVEWDIPVYGIDIEETAHTETHEFLIEDPLKAQDDLPGYIKRNQTPAMKIRDEYIDGRREIVMAARLKYLLKKYKQVLFTGGLAHWSEIQRLLNDSGLKPATQISEDQSSEYTRVLVHPAFALPQMDILPNITAWYEKQRDIRGNRHKNSIKEIFINLFYTQLNAAYGSYFNDATGEIEPSEKQKILERWPGFRQLLENLCAVTQRHPLHFASLLDLAETALSDNFRDILLDTFLRGDIRWTLPEDFPDLPVMVPAGIDSDGAGKQSAREAIIGVPEENRNDRNKTKYHFSDSFLLNVPGDKYRSTLVSADWFMPEGYKTGQTETSFYNPWVWPPCEYLLHGTAYEAANMVKLNKINKRTEIFEGSLLEGVDIKATIRAGVKGDKNIYINSKRENIKEDRSITNGTSLDPTVFIFEEYSKMNDGHWELGAAGNPSIRNYVEALELTRFDQKIYNLGDYFIGSAAIEKSGSVPDSLRHVLAYMKELAGFVTFGNPCAHVMQSVEWLKATRYDSCPVIRNLSIWTLLKFYEIHHDININLDDWAQTLVRLAIPYASARVVIIAPDNYVPDPISYNEARKKNIDLDIVPLSSFPKDRVKQLRKRYAVYAGPDGLKFSKKAEQLLGPSNKYIEMLPVRMREQVHRNS